MKHILNQLIPAKPSIKHQPNQQSAQDGFELNISAGQCSQKELQQHPRHAGPSTTFWDKLKEYVWMFSFLPL